MEPETFSDARIELYFDQTVDYVCTLYEQTIGVDDVDGVDKKKEMRMTTMTKKL